MGLKNILLFAGHNQSKRGGMSDFVDSFDSVFAAKKYIETDTVQTQLLDTLPSLQWAHLYDTTDKRIVITGTAEIWDKTEIGTDEATFTWQVAGDDNKQPLFVQIAEESARQAAIQKANAEIEEANIAQTEQASLCPPVELDTQFDLFNINSDAAVDGVFAKIGFTVSLAAMRLEGEIKAHNITIDAIGISDDDKNYLCQIGGPCAPKHWADQVKTYFADEDMLVKFISEQLTPAEYQSITQDCK